MHRCRLLARSSTNDYKIDALLVRPQSGNGILLSRSPCRKVCRRKRYYDDHGATSGQCRWIVRRYAIQETFQVSSKSQAADDSDHGSRERKTQPPPKN